MCDCWDFLAAGIAPPFVTPLLGGRKQRVESKKGAMEERSLRNTELTHHSRFQLNFPFSRHRIISGNMTRVGDSIDPTNCLCALYKRHDYFKQLCSNEGKIVPALVLPHEAE